jgi:3-methyladenine DNA glycosylase AlkD
VLIQEYAKNEALHTAIRKRVDKLRNDDEYYVKKAVQWIDRDLEKHRNPLRKRQK